ncbi:unnamed protein product [Musa acuminata var. zebrina]
MAAAASSAADPWASSSSPRSGRVARHPRSHVVRGEPDAPAAGTPPSHSSPPPPLPAVVIPSQETADRSPRKPPPEDLPPSSEAAGGKKQAWKRPANGSIDAGAAVMGGAASWPALSESAKACPRSPSSDALKPHSDGLLSASLGHAISTSSPKTNSNPSSPARQKSMKRGGSGGDGGSGEPTDGGAALPSPPPASSPLPLANLDKQAPPEISPRGKTTKNTSNWDHSSPGGSLGSHAHVGGDHLRSYGFNQRWKNGSGAGSHHNNFGSRYDQDRGGYEGYRRNAGGRDIHMQQRGARPYLRPPAPPVTPPFLSPPPQVLPYGNQIVFPDMSSPIFYVATQPPPEGVPFVPHPAVPSAMFIPAIDPQCASLLKQIDYYFSSDNLCRDVFLRNNMDEKGWVPISLIAGFNRVRQLTTSVDFILDTLRLSTVVEVQGDKVRKRNDWMNWVLPPGNVSGQSPATLNSDNLAARLQSVGLEGAAVWSSTRVPNHGERFLSRSASGNLRNQLQVAVNSDRDDTGKVIGLAESDRTKSGRSLFRSDTL